MKLNKIKNYIYKIRSLVNLKIKLYFKSKKYNILKEPEKYNPIIYHIKDDSWEISHLPEVFKICKSSTSLYYHPKQDILLLSYASVSDESDLIITKDGVIWDKSYLDNFTKVIPLDSNLLSYDEDSAVIESKKHKVFVNQECISLLGVHANIWAHFIVQFLPKLYYAEDAGLLNRNIIILIPDYKDSHIKEIVTKFIAHFPHVHLLYAKTGVEYFCKKLYHLPVSSVISNHAQYIITADEVFPSIVLNKIQKKLIEPLLELSINNSLKYEKIYLVRRNVYRGMKNYEEVEKYFIKENFFFVEPHKLSLIDKVTLFNNAKIIAGPLSSAFSNLMFCQRGAKALVFANLARMVEPYLPELANIGGVKLLYVTGKDYSSNIHTDYTIEISRIEKAYKELINE